MSKLYCKVLRAKSYLLSHILEDLIGDTYMEKFQGLNKLTWKILRAFARLPTLFCKVNTTDVVFPIPEGLNIPSNCFRFSCKN